MLRRRCRHRRPPCPECGSRTVFVRYERPTRTSSALVLHAPSQVRCTNKRCDRYWR